MELFVLDGKFNSLYNLDVFESLIWTERYNGCGNFEFYTPVNPTILQVVNVVQEKMENKLDTYVWLKDSGTTMIIEDLEITTDTERGNHLIVSGRGLESILDRRIVWERTVLNSKLQYAIQRLLNENVINPEIADRKLPNFSFLESTNEYITSLKLDSQHTGDNLYDVIMEICDVFQLGFDVYLDQNNHFVFTLKYGEDRSYAQDKNPYVVFSPSYENIINSDYLESIKTLKNVTLVAGEDSGNARRTLVVGSASGLARRETYTDARDIQSEVDGGKLSDADYNSALQQRGNERLADHKYTKIFTGEIEASKTFVYNEDFFIGDIVQITNEYNMESRVRVSEIVRVQDTTGYSMYPTFQVIE